MLVYYYILDIITLGLTTDAEMSLCILKTRDLSWQDHSINIEIILAPRKTDLLSKQHRSLGSKCNHEVNRFELKQNSFLKHLQLEKRHVGHKATDYYVLKAKRFLDNFPVDMRKEMLNRRSFSEALNKIRDEVVESQERVKSEPIPSHKSDSPPEKSDTSVGMFPQLSTRPRKNKPKNRTKDDFYLTAMKEEDYMKKDELPPVIIEYDQSRPGKSTLRRSKTEYLSATRESTGCASRPKLARQKSVRFEKDDDSTLKKISLQEKVRDFIKEQEYFNSQVHQLNKQHLKLDDDADGKDKLVSAFENFCKTENYSKTQLHKLVKLASKFKVTKSITNSADNFKSSKSFEAIQRKSGMQSSGKPISV